MSDLRTPAQRSELSEKGRSIDTRMVTATGGQLSYVNDIFRPENKAKRIRNFHQYKRGVFSSRNAGWKRDNSVALNAGATGLDFGVYIDGLGVQTLLAQFGSSVFAYDISAHTGTAVTGMTGLSATAVPCMRPYSPSTSSTSPITIWCNGVGEPRKVTSTTTSAALLFNSPGVWPGVFNTKTYTKPKFCSPFGDRMAYCGFDNGGASGNAVTRDVLISNATNAEAFTVASPVLATDACVFTLPGIMGAPTAMRSLKINNNNSTEVLIIGCQNGIAIITGTNTTNYSLQILTLGHGILSNRTFVQLDNSLLYLATDGIRQYSGEANNSSLLMESLTLDIYDEILKIDMANGAKAHAVHHPATQEVQFWIPNTGDTGKPQHCIILNYNTVDGAPIFYTKDGTTVIGSIEFNQTFYGMNDAGFVQKHYDGNFYDGTVNTTTIPGAELTLSLISTGNPAQSCSIRQMCVIADGDAQKCVINATAYEKMSDNSLRKQRMPPYDYVLESAAADGTELGDWTLGVGAFPADHPKLLDAYVPLGQGRYWEVTLQCTESSHNLDFAALHSTISIGGMRT